MNKWGVSVLPKPPPRKPGWGVSSPRPNRWGWATGRQGPLTSFQDPFKGQFAGRVGINGPHPPTWRNGTGLDLDVAYSAVAAAGVQWLRGEFVWHDVQPTTQHVWRWDYTDAMMTSASNHGLDVLGLLAYSAPWANQEGYFAYPPTTDASFAAYCVTVVQRYGPGGAFWAENPSLPYNPVMWWEITNEPWLAHFWKPNPEPARAGSLMVAAVSAIKAASPTVKTMIPGDVYQSREDGTGNAQPWATALYEAAPTLLSLVDAVAAHPYPSSTIPNPLQDSTTSYSRILQVRDIAARYAGRPIPIWVTEIGWNNSTQPDGVSEANAGTYTRNMLGRTFQMWGQATAHVGAIEKVFYYTYDRSGTDPANSQHHYSLLRSDLTPKPAWAEFVKYT